MASSNPKTKITHEWLPVSVLTFPEHAQRSQHKQIKIDKIANNFDPDAIGVIEVSVNGGSKYDVIDGWHRVLAMRQIGWGDQKVPCNVHHDLTHQEESGLFDKLNDETAVRYYDRFRVRTHAGEPTAVAVNAIIESLGLVISDQGSEGHITAVRAVEKVYSGARMVAKHDNPDALRTTLRILTGAWGKQYATFRGELISGVGLVVLRHGKTLDTDDIVRRLSVFSGGPGTFTGVARGIKQMKGCTLDHAVASLVVDTYNKTRRTKKLPDWWAA